MNNLLPTTRTHLAATVCLLLTTGIGSAVPVGFRHIHVEGDGHHHHEHDRSSQADHSSHASDHHHHHLNGGGVRPANGEHRSQSDPIFVSVPRAHYHVSWGPIKSTVPDHPSSDDDDSAELLLLMDDLSVLASRCIETSGDGLVNRPPITAVALKLFSTVILATQDVDRRCDVARHARTGVQLF